MTEARIRATFTGPGLASAILRESAHQTVYNSIQTMATRTCQKYTVGVSNTLIGKLPEEADKELIEIKVGGNK